MFKLKLTAQCEKCPWRIDVDPNDIPNGYCPTLHKRLENTIADPADPLSTLRQSTLAVMACHEHEDAHCVGWLANQLGPGNNIALRLRMMDCENLGRVRLKGPQRQTFAETLAAATGDQGLE